MDTLTLIKNALNKDDSVVDSLLTELHEYAQSELMDGLPMWDKQIDAMRLVVIRWLLSLEDKAMGMASERGPG